VKHLPGRKTDAGDGARLAQLLKCGLMCDRLVPRPVMGWLRDLTGYQKTLVQEWPREIQRVQKLLDAAGIKLDSVGSDVMGKAPRAMFEALIAGERDPKVLPEMALTRMHPTIPELRLVLEGGFGTHHGLMLRAHLDHIDHLAALIDRVDAEMGLEIALFSDTVERLCAIPGVGERTARVIIAEIGVDMSQFPTAENRASAARLCPRNHESAGKWRSSKHRGDAALRKAYVGPAWSAARTCDTCPAAQFGRLCRRFGKKGEARAAFVVAPSLLVVVWHILADDFAYVELGADHFQCLQDPKAHAQRLAHQIEKLDYKVNFGDCQLRHPSVHRLGDQPARWSNRRVQSRLVLGSATPPGGGVTLGKPRGEEPNIYWPPGALSSCSRKDPVRRSTPTPSLFRFYSKAGSEAQPSRRPTHPMLPLPFPALVTSLSLCD